jgi:plastocyanin
VRKVIALAVVIGSLVAATTAVAATRSVTMGDNWYVRERGVPTVTVRAGDTVVWRNRGDNPHNVIVRRGRPRFRSSVVTPGRTYRRRVTRRGTYLIYCSIHGQGDQSMRLRVR